METKMKNGIDLEFLVKVLSLTADMSYTDIWWRTDGDYAPVSIFVNCYNVFAQGFADCECITPENIHVFEECVQDIRPITTLGDQYISMLFCARVRGQRPREEMYPDNELIAALLDACGPYVLYPEQESIPPFKPLYEDIKHTLKWWERLLVFIKNLLAKIGIGKERA